MLNSGLFHIFLFLLGGFTARIRFGSCCYPWNIGPSLLRPIVSFLMSIHSEVNSFRISLLVCCIGRYMSISVQFQNSNSTQDVGKLSHLEVIGLCWKNPVPVAQTQSVMWSTNALICHGYGFKTTSCHRQDTNTASLNLQGHWLISWPE